MLANFSTEAALLSSDHSEIHVTRNRFKILVTGGKRSGKSAFIDRIEKKSFNVNEISEKVFKVVTRVVFGEIVRAELEEVDIDEFTSENQTTRDWLDVQAVLLLYNSTDSQSFKLLNDEMPLIQRKLAPNSLIVLVGTNADKSEEQQVSWKISEQFAEKQALSLFEVSSKTGINCESVIEETLDSLLERRYAEQEAREGNITEQPVYQSTVEQSRDKSETRFNLFCWVPKIPYFST